MPAADRRAPGAAAGEQFTIEYVTGKSWSGYNWYQGNYRSLIQVNTDLPIFIDRALDLACHEGYPGHHVLQRAARTSSGARAGLAGVHGLSALLAAIAHRRRHGELRHRGGVSRLPSASHSSATRLFPLAGLDPAAAPKYYEVLAVLDRLAYAGNEAARRYLDGQITASQAADWLVTYTLTSRPRAEQRVRFFDQYRSYVINYNLGKDLVRAYVERMGGTRRQARGPVEGLRRAAVVAETAVRAVRSRTTITKARRRWHEDRRLL